MDEQHFPGSTVRAFFSVQPDGTARVEQGDLKITFEGLEVIDSRYFLALASEYVPIHHEPGKED